MNGQTDPPIPSQPQDLNEAFRSGGRSVEFLDEINKASMLCETNIVPRELGARIARGIAQVMANEPRAQRSADYLDYEPRLIAIAGPEASRLQ
jgi:argininosuccinate lyase